MTREKTRIDGIYRVEHYGGSLTGYLTASYVDLVALLGEPNSPGDSYKVSTEWTLELEDGTQFSLYDYKETSLYSSRLPSVEDFRAKASYQWHIGGENMGLGGPLPSWAKRVKELIATGILNLQEGD